MSPYAERIVALEFEVRDLKHSLAEQQTETGKRFDSLETKLDALLTLKDKGVGAFWLATIIVGSGLIGVIVEIMKWFSGR